MTKFIRRFCLFISLRLAENSFVWFTNLSHSSDRISFLQSLQFLISCGITTPWLKLFFQLSGTLAISLPPPVILKYSFLSRLSLTLVNRLKLLCSSITPYLFIVQQYFILELKRDHTKYHHLYNHFYLVICFYQLVPRCLIYPNVYFQCIMNLCLYNKHQLYKIHW